MEVFVAILLLFGAFSLGSTISSGAVDASTGVEIPATAYARQDPPGKGVEAGEVEYAQIQDCLADRHFVIYRDLTGSHDPEVVTEATDYDECEGECEDE